MKGFELFRKFFGKKERSAQSLTGAAGLTQNGVLTEGHGEVVFFIVSPLNISVLSREAVGEKVGRLAALFSAQGDIEIFCADARENFGNNMTYLYGRIREEKNEKVRELLKQGIMWSYAAGHLKAPSHIRHSKDEQCRR